MEFPEQYKEPFEKKLDELWDVVQAMFPLVNECMETDNIVSYRDGLKITISKDDSLDEKDMFGIMSHAETGHDEIVVLKTKVRKICVEQDGMTPEEFEEFWEYNIAGAKGRYSYSVVDDTLSGDMIEEILENDESGDIINPPHRKD